MINDPMIKKALYEWGTGEISGTIFAHENSNNQPFPSASFCVFNTFSTAKIAHDEKLYTYLSLTDQFNEEISGPRSIMVSVNFYNNDSFSKIHQLQASLQKQNTLDKLYLNGLSFISAGSISELTEVVSSKWEERFQMDVNFYINSVYNSLIERIVQAPVEGNIDGIITDQLIG